MIASCIHFIGVIFYGIFASGEVQSWAEDAVVCLTIFMFCENNFSIPVFFVQYQEEKIELKDNATKQTFGVEAGYSMDYNEVTTKLGGVVEDNGMGYDDHGKRTDPGSSSGPSNPFTQQQYQV